MKRISSNPRSAIATTAVIGIVVVIAIVAIVGAYVAAGSKTVTTGGTTVTVPTTVTSVSTGSGSLTTITTVSGGSTLTQTQTISSTVTSSITSSVTFSLTSSLEKETMTETGSSLLYPLFELWAPAFTAMYPTIQFTPVSSGSGTGQADAENGAVTIGASDPFLSNAVAAAYPYILNIPLAVSAQQIDYNIPNIPATDHLNFTGNVLAAIYNGTITNWDSPLITGLQSPSVAALLTNLPIVPIVRSDSSGDTNLFTTFLADTNPSWPSTAVGNAPTWPKVAGEQSADLNSGMVTACQQYTGCVAYIGISYLEEATHPSSGTALGYAYLGNKAGNFVNISSTDIQAAVSAQAPNTPASERISLEYTSPANAYPIVNFEYALVSENQNVTGMATALKTFLEWAIDPQYGNSPTYLNQVEFIPLPQNVLALDLAQINEITGP